MVRFLIRECNGGEEFFNDANESSNSMLHVYWVFLYNLYIYINLLFDWSSLEFDWFNFEKFCSFYYRALCNRYYSEF